MNTEAEKKEQARQLNKAQLAHDYDLTFTTEPGQRVWTDLMRRTHPFTNAFTGNSRTFHLLGEQAIGQHLLKMRAMVDYESIKKYIKTAEEEENKNGKR